MIWPFVTQHRVCISSSTALPPLAAPMTYEFTQLSVQGVQKVGLTKCSRMGRKPPLPRLPYLEYLAIQSKEAAIRVINEGQSRVIECDALTTMTTLSKYSQDGRS